jgi:hypothetical protein
MHLWCSQGLGSQAARQPSLLTALGFLAAPGKNPQALRKAPGARGHTSHFQNVALIAGSRTGLARLDYAATTHCDATDWRADPSSVLPCRAALGDGRQARTPPYRWDSCGQRRRLTPALSCGRSCMVRHGSPLPDAAVEDSPRCSHSRLQISAPRTCGVRSRWSRTVLLGYPL